MWLIWLTLACQQEQDSALRPPDITAPDQDQDGFIALGPFGNDCDDQDPAIHPGASDLTCDGVDNDCDGRDSVDADDDGATVCADDCDDADPARSRLQAERCDRVDNDCDGLIDDDFDQDGDGWVTCGAVSPTPIATVPVTDGVITALYAVDIDHDGASEIVAFDAEHGRVSVFLSAPGAPLSTVLPLTTDPARAVRPVGDLDGDGLDELAVAARTDDRPSPYAVALHRGAMVDGQPAFAADPLYWTPGTLGFGLAAVGLGDVDRDGRADLALYGQRSDDPLGPAYPGQLWLAHGAARGGLERVEPLGELTFDHEPTLYAADLDGDAVNEVVAVRPDPFITRSATLHRVPIAPGARGTTLEYTLAIDAVHTTGQSIDGGAADQLVTLLKADAAIGGFAAGYRADPAGYLSLVDWFIQPTFWAEGTDRTQVVPDLDHDGRPDLLVAEHDAAAVLEAWGLDERGQARRSGRGDGAGQELSDFIEVSVEAADVDGDGRLEAMVAETVDRARTTLYVFELGTDCDDADPGRNADCR